MHTSKRFAAALLYSVLIAGGSRPVLAGPSFLASYSQATFGRTQSARLLRLPGASLPSQVHLTRLFSSAGRSPLRGLFARAHIARVSGEAFGLADTPPRLNIALVGIAPLNATFDAAMLPNRRFVAVPTLAVPTFLPVRSEAASAVPQVGELLAFVHHVTVAQSNLFARTTVPSFASIPAIRSPQLRLDGVSVFTRFSGSSLQDRSLGRQQASFQSAFAFSPAQTASALHLQSGYERFAQIDPSVVFALPLINPMLLAPNVADLTKQTLGASLALPITPGVSLGLAYGRSRLFGSYGAIDPINVNASDSTYLGKLTLRLPHSSNAITFSARRTLYQDNLIPTLNLPQEQNDINLSIKF